MATPSSTKTVIPEAKFIEDVEEYLKGRTAEAAIQELQQNYQTYKIGERQLLQHRARLTQKLPEIKKTLDVVSLLIQQSEQGGASVVDFALADNVFAEAKLEAVETVQLWLGANVMLEYPLEEARELLATNLGNCEKNLETNRKDIDWLKDLITITEVSIARIYNHDVVKRKQEAAEES